jgi:hypothetical protein
MLAEHVPNDGDVGAEDAAEWLEDRVCAKRDVVPGEVWATATKDDCKTDGGDHAGSVFMVSGVATPCAHKYNLRKTDTEDETQDELFLGLQLQVPYHRHWHKEDPDIGDQIRDVGKVRERDHGKAITLDFDVPVRIQWSAGKEQCDCYANAPCRHE